MADAELHLSDAPSRTPPAGTKTETVTPVEAKGGTDKPKNMPIVLLVSTVGAAAAMFVVWTFFIS